MGGSTSIPTWDPVDLGKPPGIQPIAHGGSTPPHQGSHHRMCSQPHKEFGLPLLASCRGIQLSVGAHPQEGSQLTAGDPLPQWIHSQPHMDPADLPGIHNMPQPHAGISHGDLLAAPHGICLCLPLWEGSTSKLYPLRESHRDPGNWTPCPLPPQGVSLDLSDWPRPWPVSPFPSPDWPVILTNRSGVAAPPSWENFSTAHPLAVNWSVS